MKASDLAKVRFFYILFSMIVLPSQVFAGNITLSATLTDHSSIVMSGSVDAGTKWLWLRVQKASEANSVEDLFPKLDGVNFSKTLYFRQGPGQYVISAYQKTTDPQFGSGYYLIHQFPVENQDSRNVSFLLPSDKVQSDDPAIMALASNVTLGLGDDMAKSRAIHDWVSGHIAYDVAAMLAGQTHDYSATETLSTLKAFCSGYAHLNAALHRAVGLPAKVIQGKASFRGVVEDHAWNEILVNGNWILEDTTWDAGGVLPNNVFKFSLSHVYFNPNPVVFYQDHGPGTPLNL